MLVRWTHLAEACRSSIATFLFPVFASYKALKGNDPGELAPWLMYWVVLACLLLVESWCEWILVWYEYLSTTVHRTAAEILACSHSFRTPLIRV